MKRFTSILLIATLALGAPAFAGKKGKKGKGDGEGKNSLAATMKQYDTNGNHQIDGAEIATLTAAFAAAPATSPLKKLDRNGNGVLDEDEVTALNARAGFADGGKGKKKKKT